MYIPMFHIQSSVLLNKIDFDQFFAQFRDDLDTFNKIYNDVKENYTNNKPRYLSYPKASYIKLIDYEEYKTLSVGKVQEILIHRHIVITNVPPELVGVTSGPVEFDEAGLC